jgi:hypothetical protein
VTRPLTLILLAIAALATLVPAALVHYAPPVPTMTAKRPARLPPRRVVPAAELPQVEPVELVDLALDDARAYNASVPYVPNAVIPARPFRFGGGTEDRARAVDCLAAALIYEAGDDAAGERSVAQVILNRLRHPAYPKTVCAVVFQGSERRTGCQFTFTCDGALTRWKPSEAGWARAQGLAAAALNGAVDRSVGLATHYHTDWVVPYWQSSLDKIAKVGTHLFFRWTGWWGSPAAFTAPTARAEPAVAKLAALSPAHRAAAGAEGEALALEAGAAAAAAPPAGAGAAPVPTDAASFLVTLPPRTSPDAYPLLAMEACGERAQCRYSAWARAADTPRALPLLPEQVAAMSFSYLRDRAAGVDKLLWNCQLTPRMTRAQCMKNQALAPVPAPSPSATPRGPADLTGVRRRPGRDPAPEPTPEP